MGRSQKLTMTYLLLAVVVVLGAATFQITEAADYQVGDSSGWFSPSSTNFYSNWADDKNFVLGDNLIFSFATNVHDVAEVTENAYDSCDITNPIYVIRNGPATIPLNRTGDHYYICTISNHCQSGQKLQVEVANATSTPSPTTSPGTTNSTPAPPPPSPSSASYLGATITLMFMSIAMGFMCYF